MAFVRALGGLALAVVAGCHTHTDNALQPPAAAEASSDVIIAPEPTVAPDRDGRQGCDFVSDFPWLVLLPDHWLLDGRRVTPWELEKSLNAKRELRADIGGPPVRDMSVTVTDGVSPTELDHAISIAASFRYDHVFFKFMHRPAARKEPKKRRTPH